MQVPGLDMAWAFGGYVYHTKFDPRVFVFLLSQLSFVLIEQLGHCRQYVTRLHSTRWRYASSCCPRIRQTKGYPDIYCHTRLWRANWFDLVAIWWAIIDPNNNSLLRHPAMDHDCVQALDAKHHRINRRCRWHPCCTPFILSPHFWFIDSVHLLRYRILMTHPELDFMSFKFMQPWLCRFQRQ